MKYYYLIKLIILYICNAFRIQNYKGNVVFIFPNTSAEIKFTPFNMENLEMFFSLKITVLKAMR